MEGKDVGDFEIKRIIGEGALGPVYLAEHKFIKKLFALKFLPHQLMENAEFKAKFSEDIAKIASLNHENLALVHNVSSFKDGLFIVSDFVSYKAPLSMNLASYLTTCSERLGEEEILEIVKQVAFALDYIHTQSILSEPIFHGGLKLTNILLSEKRDGGYTVKLTDTGLASMLGTDFILSHMVDVLAKSFGSKEEASQRKNFRQVYAFLAPEQRFAQTEEVNFKADIYAFGVLTYFLLMGYLPEGNFDMPSSIYKNSRVDWDRVIKATMKQMPTDRPDNLMELLKSAASMVSLEEVKVPTANSAYSFLAASKKIPQEKEKEKIFAAAETPNAAKELAEQKAAKEKEEVYKAPTATATVTDPSADMISIDQLEQNLIGGMTKTVKARPMSTKVVTEEKEEEVSAPKDPTLIFKKEKYVGAYKQEKIDTEGIKPLITESILIQGGEYDRGSNVGARDEKPRHRVKLSPFKIDIHPVTNEQFLRFLLVMEGEKDNLNHDTILLKESRIKRHGGEITIETGYAKHPVVGVSYYGAKAYAKWIGKRLPTEAEWEAAASNGNAKNVFPFGEEIERGQANFFSSDTTPVMSYPPSKNGLYDMVGNVYEWCMDWYDYSYYETSEIEPDNPAGPKQGVYRVLRGGCWKSLIDDMRCSHRFRNNPGTMNKTYGFRCVSTVEEM